MIIEMPVLMNGTTGNERATAVEFDFSNCQCS